MGLVGVSSAVDACPDRFYWEFRGDLSKSVECVDWSLGIVCRRFCHVLRHEKGDLSKLDMPAPLLALCQYVKRPS
ncbi:unnamed protein product [Prunus armeniaca]